MKPVIIDENKIYAIGYSYATDWKNLCRTTDRAAYWSVIDFSNMDKSAYAAIENKSGMEIAFWLCRETGDFEMRFFFGERVDAVGTVPEGTLDPQFTSADQSAYVEAIRNLWQYIIEEWLPGSGYRHDDEKCNFEVYYGDVMQIYIPIC